MVICHRILTPVIILIRTVVVIVTTIVRTVCEWVSTTITTVKEVCNEVCGWLGPFSFLCDWVCKLIEVVETVWDWVCENIIETIITIIEIITEAVIYILRWVCWLIDLPLRVLAFLRCLALGDAVQAKFMNVCVVILADNAGNQAISMADAEAALEGAAAIFLRNCNIRLNVLDFRVVRAEDHLDGTTCDFGGMFTSFFLWFSQNARPDCVTVYFVNSIDGACGCAYPGTDWVTVAAPSSTCAADRLDCVVAQEIGHLADIWPHSDDVGNNVMANPCGRSFTRVQCCIIRTSRIVSNLPHLIGTVGLDNIVPISVPDEPEPPAE